MKHDTKMFITIQKKISNLQIISTYYRVVLCAKHDIALCGHWMQENYLNINETRQQS